MARHADNDYTGALSTHIFVDGIRTIFFICLLCKVFFGPGGLSYGGCPGGRGGGEGLGCRGLPWGGGGGGLSGGFCPGGNLFGGGRGGGGGIKYNQPCVIKRMVDVVSVNRRL